MSHQRCRCHSVNVALASVHRLLSPASECGKALKPLRVALKLVRLVQPSFKCGEHCLGHHLVFARQPAVLWSPAGRVCCLLLLQGDAVATVPCLKMTTASLRFIHTRASINQQVSAMG